MRANQSNTVAEACSTTLNNYHLCLNKSGRNPAKCRDLEKGLLGCSKSLKKDYCIDEINGLLDCSRHPSNDICAKEFVAMRECNRTTGPEILIQDGNYVLSPKHASKYTPTSLDICATAAPSRSRSALQETLHTLHSLLGLANTEERNVPYKWESLRPNPGQ
ncbi:hypothetical protein IE077_004115 [Cardiosporidium cionae]|uniref:IMS import disulfide relay-system CHCH-CHCH-like Cx9C domain-containing protein n=1 Tax=Cardiosporidium cionae TaxID=476202 RepID=A0ABQ7JE30_9APIC|nr:hypothetical protein IE077_004115 [Cardiosporidium cionae]|eukprot:KAF8822276.1 hypothetical protein IE077_004115 [Cardiosporidium cionae]